MAAQPIPATGKLPFPAPGPPRDGSGLTARGRRNLAIAGVTLIVVVGAVMGTLAATGELDRSTSTLVGTWSGTCLPSPRAETVTLRFAEDGAVSGLASGDGQGFTRWSLDGDVLVLAGSGRSTVPVSRLRVTEPDPNTLVLAGDGTTTSTTVRCNLSRVG